MNIILDTQPEAVGRNRGTWHLIYANPCLHLPAKPGSAARGRRWEPGSAQPMGSARDTLMEEANVSEEHLASLLPSQRRSLIFSRGKQQLHQSFTNCLSHFPLQISKIQAKKPTPNNSVMKTCKEGTCGPTSQRCASDVWSQLLQLGVRNG